MSDTPSPGTIASIMLAVTGLITSIAVLFGGRKDRDAGIADAANIALHVAREEREQTTQTRIERDTCKEQLAAMDTRVRDLERRLASLMDELSVRDQRIALLEHEQVIARDMLHHLMRTDSTPPRGVNPADVRAALRSQS